jgi:hypothetical protein
MDFFGNVQNVEVEGGVKRNETEWQDELRAIENMIAEAKKRHNESLHTSPQHASVIDEVKDQEAKRQVRKEGAVKVDEEEGWSKQIIGAATLLGCGGVWFAASFLESV